MIGDRHPGSREGAKDLKTNCKATIISRPTKITNSPVLIAAASLRMVSLSIFFDE